MNEDQLFQPDQLTPDENDIIIVELTAESYPDRRRVRVAFRLSGYRKSLGASITVIDKAGTRLASADIVNFFVPHSEVTLHLQKKLNPSQEYLLEITLYKLLEIESELEPGKVGAIETKTLDQRSQVINFR